MESRESGSPSCTAPAGAAINSHSPKIREGIARAVNGACGPPPLRIGSRYRLRMRRSAQLTGELIEHGADDARVGVAGDEAEFTEPGDAAALARIEVRLAPQHLLVVRQAGVAVAAAAVL